MGMMGVRDKKLFVKVFLVVGRKKKKSCGEGDEERELTRTILHGRFSIDLGHVPFREV